MNSGSNEQIYRPPSHLTVPPSASIEDALSSARQDVGIPQGSILGNSRESILRGDGGHQSTFTDQMRQDLDSFMDPAIDQVIGEIHEEEKKSGLDLSEIQQRFGTFRERYFRQRGGSFDQPTARRGDQNEDLFERPTSEIERTPSEQSQQPPTHYSRSESEPVTSSSQRRFEEDQFRNDPRIAIRGLRINPFGRIPEVSRIPGRVYSRQEIQEAWDKLNDILEKRFQQSQARITQIANTQPDTWMNAIQAEVSAIMRDIQSYIDTFDKEDLKRNLINRFLKEIAAKAGIDLPQESADLIMQIVNPRPGETRQSFREVMRSLIRSLQQPVANSKIPKLVLASTAGALGIGSFKYLDILQKIVDLVKRAFFEAQMSNPYPPVQDGYSKTIHDAFYQKQLKFGILPRACRRVIFRNAQDQLDFYVECEFQKGVFTRYV